MDIQERLETLMILKRNKVKLQDLAKMLQVTNSWVSQCLHIKCSVDFSKTDLAKVRKLVDELKGN